MEPTSKPTPKKINPHHEGRFTKTVNNSSSRSIPDYALNVSVFKWLIPLVFVILTTIQLSYPTSLLGVVLPHIQSPLVFPDLYEASVLELQAGLDAGHFLSVDLVNAYFARIREVNTEGPALRAVLELNPSALGQAAALDEERRKTGRRSLLHGIPVLLKDNIATDASEGMNTTAGSYSLLGSLVRGDAGVVVRLRKAGAIILGKANLSEFAYVRGNLSSGWSGIGGQCTNAYFPNGDPCGSSSGSGVAASIGLAAVTLGTETDGSIICPSSWNNIAGIKPTVGWTSRAGVIPISSHQDTVGPMTRSLTDSAIVLSIIAGKDENDNYTLAQPDVVPDFVTALDVNALRGKRIGVPRAFFLNSSITGVDPFVDTTFEAALDTIRSLGATVVDPADLPYAMRLAETDLEKRTILLVDFKIELNAYLKTLTKVPTGVRSLAELIKYNDDNPILEKPPGYEDQSIFMISEKTAGYNSTYFDILALNREMGATHGIDEALRKYDLDALVLPSTGVTPHASALVGYPIVNVPLGFYPEDVQVGGSDSKTFYPAPGIPFGISFLGTAFSDFKLIGFGYAFEQSTKSRLKRRAYPAAIPRTQLPDVVGKGLR